MEPFVYVIPGIISVLIAAYVFKIVFGIGELSKVERLKPQLMILMAKKSGVTQEEINTAIAKVYGDLSRLKN